MGTRLFAALIPSEEAVEHLDGFLDPRRDAADFRWTLADQFHITLAFLPDVAEGRVDDYIDRLADGLERTPLPDLRLAGPVVFPDAAATKVLAVGVQPVSEAADVVVERMAGRARNAAVKVGTRVDGQRYRPHVTVARLRRPADTTAWVRLLETYAGPEWPVYEVAVVASYLGEGPGGRPRYQTLAEIPIGN
ncbi:RNA 2',3'-cyclic phosphodiesterase [Nocardioides sp. BGMRC 2183]|nr:RNA 2',3'-cyclic phosphodiesterase [Nocardioides sp. BGMRC 2183]